MGAKNCCYGCTDRHLACHDHCDMYKEFKKERERVQTNRKGVVETGIFDRDRNHRIHDYYMKKKKK